MHMQGFVFFHSIRCVCAFPIYIRLNLLFLLLKYLFKHGCFLRDLFFTWWPLGRWQREAKFQILLSRTYAPLTTRATKNKTFRQKKGKKEIWHELADEKKARPSSKDRIQSNYPNKPDAISQISAASGTQKKKKQLMPEKYLRSDNKINT